MPKIDNTLFYQNAYKKHGKNAKGLNWNNKFSQKIRFELIVEFLKPICHDKDSLVDAGCGFGDFYHYLKKEGLECHYTGYDVMEKFVQIAKENTKQPIMIKDILTDELEVAEFYVASGSLNILTSFETYLFIKRCYEHSKKAFIFNMLEGGYHERFNLVREKDIVEYGKELGAEVTVKKGYLMEDFTVCFSHS